MTLPPRRVTRRTCRSARAVETGAARPTATRTAVSSRTARRLVDLIETADLLPVRRPEPATKAASYQPGGRWGARYSTGGECATGNRQRHDGGHGGSRPGSRGT